MTVFRVLVLYVCLCFNSPNFCTIFVLVLMIFSKYKGLLLRIRVNNPQIKKCQQFWQISAGIFSAYSSLSVSLFCCLDCKMVHIFRWAIWLPCHPRLFKDSEILPGENLKLVIVGFFSEKFLHFSPRTFLFLWH